MQAKTVGIIYTSGGGNTQEVAELIAATCTEKNIPFHIQKLKKGEPFPAVTSFDLLLLGAYTIGDGRTPELMIEFLKTHEEKHKNVAVFGTGETQWREYCGAVDRLARFHQTPYPTLKIEQSPRGAQEVKVKQWTVEVINQWQKN